MIETRNGSNEPLQQFVWGLQYVDELVEIFSNIDSGAEQFHYALHDANWNVLGVVDRYSGMLEERYEYTPYGERVVFRRAHWSEGLYAPTLSSRRVKVGSVEYPWGICAIGHQGLMHDEALGLVYNRARMLYPGLGRFIQRDPLGLCGWDGVV